MNAAGLTPEFLSFPALDTLIRHQAGTLRIGGLAGSSKAFVASAVMSKRPGAFLFICQDKEEALYLLNDLENTFDRNQVAFFPESYRRAYDVEDTDNANVLLRTEALNKIRKGMVQAVVTYPNALAEKVITQENIAQKTQSLSVGEAVDLDFIVDFLIDFGFEREDFVYEPGQFAIRGGIVDVFSFSYDLPFRIEFNGDRIDSIRSFETDSQLSVEKFAKMDILPNIEQKAIQEFRQSLLDFMPKDTCIWYDDKQKTAESIQHVQEKARKEYEKLFGEIRHLDPTDLFLSEKEFYFQMERFACISFGKQAHGEELIQFNFQGQPPFQKNFEALFNRLHELRRVGFSVYIFAEQARQIERLHEIFEDFSAKNPSLPAYEPGQLFTPIYQSIYEGFIDTTWKKAFFTDHQIFERYKRFKINSRYQKDQAVSLKELTSLQPGDYVTHIDHGVGKFGGLEKIDVNGKQQEAIKLVFKDGDTVYVSIHSLHRISKFSGKDGKEPTLNKIGSSTWQSLKAKTKRRVKELAFDLIRLYAKRRAEKGFAFSPDNYMQHELEASFIYEDTPDQHKATQDVKADMEKPYPMDRLICGDVGFGKTEVAIRAAFKAAIDGKQVAVLVPTTILALQHYKTFSARLKGMPVTVDYINRFKSPKAQKETLAKLEEGKIDILIGTHRLVGKDLKFKDLGLLVIDEEQKFGVNVKDKLKTLRVNLDTLTLSATPIPRTLQFSLLGARDMSVIRTPPANRYPVVTELRGFNEELIRDVIQYELSRNGQVYFIHNRVQNIREITGMLQRLVPDARIRFAHGQMEGHELEEVMLDFIEGDCDILVSTSIVENGLDIPNANTIIINDAHNFGLSDLHQMRGRVGRSNKKAFCYLLTPPFAILPSESRKRLSALVEFSDLGSGIYIAMKDLDIRGAGDLLGAEQSGFINEIGYETYQKILAEALQELKETDFRDVFAEELEKQGRDWTEDCSIDTDLEMLIPATYVDQIAERLILYKELDNISTEANLVKFRDRLQDRFGEVPVQVDELINGVRLRGVAKKLGFEKLVLKNGVLLAYFIQNNKSMYFESEVFTNVLKSLPFNPDAEMRQKGERVSIHFKKVDSLAKAFQTLHNLDTSHA